MKVLPLSPKLGLSFMPPGAQGDPPRAYLYKPPTGTQRQQWQARVTSIAGLQAGPLRLREIVREGLAVLCEDPADRETLLDLRDRAASAEEDALDIARRAGPVAARRAAAADAGEDTSGLDAELAALQEEAAALALSPVQVDQLERLDAALRRSHSPYARALECRMLWANVGARQACALFLTGWRHVVDAAGKPVLFRRFAGEVADELLDRLPEGDVAIVGAQILTSLFPTEDDVKKPASPAGSAGAATSSSNATDTPSSAPQATAG